MIKEIRSGFVSVIGRANAGKSTLLNWLIGEKIAMVSHKANATRKRATMIVMHEDNQIVLLSCFSSLPVTFKHAHKSLKLNISSITDVKHFPVLCNFISAH